MQARDPSFLLLSNAEVFAPEPLGLGHVLVCGERVAWMGKERPDLPGAFDEALSKAEIPARVYHPTHVNRRKALFDEALELARRGCTIDVTAFPATGGDEWSAAEAWRRYAAADLPPERLTISSDGGGCLPAFDAEGRPTGMEVATPQSLADALTELLESGCATADVLPEFTSNPAGLLRLAREGRIAAGADADLVVLDRGHRVLDVMARGRWHVLDGRAVVRGTFETE